jgi:hypothetical protein
LSGKSLIGYWIFHLSAVALAEVDVGYWIFFDLFKELGISEDRYGNGRLEYWNTGMLGCSMSYGKIRPFGILKATPV